MKSAGLEVSGLKVGAIINTSSGGCDSESEVKMLDILKDAGRDQLQNVVWRVRPD